MNAIGDSKGLGEEAPSQDESRGILRRTVQEAGKGEVAGTRGAGTVRAPTTTGALTRPLLPEALAARADDRGGAAEGARPFPSHALRRPGPRRRRATRPAPERLPPPRFGISGRRLAGSG